MNILEEIVSFKIKEVEDLKVNVPIKQLEKRKFFNKDVISLSSLLKENANKVNIIAEFKRKSPSKGIINNSHDPLSVARSYADNGAVAISVLTDKKYFGGSLEDFEIIRDNIELPILRKDFIVDEYQIIESKAIGADVILLIAACLTIEKTYHLAKLARSINMDVLLEIHEEDELSHLNEFVTLVGVNNRNLKNFNIDINTSIILGDKIPNDFIKISESGLNNAENIRKLINCGYKGFLIGEYFMSNSNPGEVLRILIKDVKELNLEKN